MPRLGLWALGLCSLWLVGLGAGLWERNSVLNVALALNRYIASTTQPNPAHGWTQPTAISAVRFENVRLGRTARRPSQVKVEIIAQTCTLSLNANATEQ